MFNRLLLKLRQIQVYYILHRFKNEKKKIRYKNKIPNQNKKKSFQKSNVNNNINNNNNNNKYSNSAPTKPNRTVIMLNKKSLKMNFIHDHILNVIFQICYHPNDHRHLFHGGDHVKPKNPKNPKTIRNCFYRFKNLPSYCCCENKVKKSANLKLSDSIRQICLYFQKNFNNLQFIIVIFLLALLSTTTATNSIETQDNKQPQRNSTSLILGTAGATGASQPAASMPSNLTGALQYLSCFYIPNAPPHDARADNSLKFKMKICNNLRHFYHHHHHRHYQHHHHYPLHTRKILKNFEKVKKYKKYFKNFEWTENNRKKNLSIREHIRNSYNRQYYNKLNSQRHDDDGDAAADDGSNIISQEKQYNSGILNTNVQNHLKQNLTKDDSNIENILQLAHNNFDGHKNNIFNINNNDTLPVNMHTNEEDDTNDNNIINNKNNGSHNADGDGDVEEKKDANKSHFSVEVLLPVTTATTSSSTHYHHQRQQNITENTFKIATDDNQHHQYTDQEIDHYKLMKLVMDGLGLQKQPNMKKVNISQQEYATKYREYLQRVHTRKRRELRDDQGVFDGEDISRPLQILSIVSNSTLIKNDHDSKEDFIIRNRPKREMIQGWNKASNNLNRDQENDPDEEDEEAVDYDLNKQVKNILLLRKKHQKPRSTKKQRDERKTNIRLMFALKPEALNLSSGDIEEANIRLVLIHSPNLAIKNHKSKKRITKHHNSSCGSNKVEAEKGARHINVLNLKLFFISKAGKRTWLDGRKVDIHVDQSKPDETHTQWLQFDVTKAVKTTIEGGRLQHVELELQCENCKRIGARILNDAHNTEADAQADVSTTEGYQLMPVLNIIGRFGKNQHTVRPHKYDGAHPNPQEEATTQRQYHHQVYNNKNPNRHNRRTNCYKTNQRCCRHAMEVTFKEIKGFEFIIQPKVFDAGYCHGRCPPRYNPAHHHAMLQSLIWKQNHQKAPRPCCAPSKLVELEVLHVDEKDSEKLKISTWSDMKVVECACS